MSHSRCNKINKTNRITLEYKQCSCATIYRNVFQARHLNIAVWLRTLRSHPALTMCHIHFQESKPALAVDAGSRAAVQTMAKQNVGSSEPVLKHRVPGQRDGITFKQLLLSGGKQGNNLRARTQMRFQRVLCTLLPGRVMSG